MILEIKVDLESLDLEEDESLSEKIKEQVIKKVVDTLSDKIKCKPEKRLTIEIHPEPIDMGVKVGYSYHDENKKNGRFREFGISNAKDLAGIDKLLIEYFGKADPNPLYDGRQLTIFDLMGGVRRKHDKPSRYSDRSRTDPRHRRTHTAHAEGSRPHPDG